MVARASGTIVQRRSRKAVASVSESRWPEATADAIASAALAAALRTSSLIPSPYSKLRAVAVIKVAGGASPDMACDSANRLPG